MAYIRNVVGAIMPGTAIAMLLGVLWKRRVTWQGGVAAILGGTGFGVAFLSIPPFNAFIISFLGGPAIGSALVALVLGVCVSLSTKKLALSDEEKMSMVLANRGRKALAKAESGDDA
jgi:SSS family solute:Na+ symporter